MSQQCDDRGGEQGITEPGSLDYTRSRRKMSDHRLQQLADSAAMKILQAAVTTIAIPLMGWGLSAVLDRLTAIERSVNQFSTQAATTELRLQQAERTIADLAGMLRAVQIESTQHGFNIRRLDERTGPPGR